MALIFQTTQLLTFAVTKSLGAVFLNWCCEVQSLWGSGLYFFTTSILNSFKLLYGSALI